MKAVIAILASAVVLMVADAVATDFWTFAEYRAQIKAQRAEIERLENDLMEYRRTVTKMTAAQ